MDPKKFAELLAKARAVTSDSKGKEAIAHMHEQLKTVDTVDVASLGLSANPQTDEEKDAVVEAIRDVVDNITASSAASHKPGVARDVTLNEKQSEFCSRAVAGESVVLIGAAGTGKTTSMKQTTRRLIDEKKLPALVTGTKWLIAGKPGMAIVSYTRKAVNNIRHAVVDELKAHTVTLHKLLEFMPMFYEIEDPNNKGNFINTMRFEPAKNAINPLPADLKRVAFEEGSMIPMDLYAQYQQATPHEPGEIWLGDLQQLPPVFGLAVLGFKMLELPVIELTEVYRQALESPIIRLAHKILEGNPFDFSSVSEVYEAVHPATGNTVKRRRWPALEAFNEEGEHGSLKIQPWQKTLKDDDALFTATKQFNVWADDGYYRPDDDIILIPFNKAFGTIELNKGIAHHLGIKREATVHEVIAGFNKHYLAVGDRVLYDKEDAFIVDIARNSDYMGKSYQPSSIYLDRWGNLQKRLSEAEKLSQQTEQEQMSVEAIEQFLESAADGVEDRVQAASHVVIIRLAYADEGEVIELDTASEINNLLGGYALTVHKFQGSENRKVFFLLHNSHAVMVSRELLYTGITRAREHLHIICEPVSFERGVKSQRIKGNTLAEKAEFFKGKASEKEKELKFKLEAELAEKQKGVAVTVTISGKKAIRLKDLVTTEMAIECGSILEKYWTKACSIWPALLLAKHPDNLIPSLSFDMGNKNAIGYWLPTKKQVRLNPVWTAVAFRNRQSDPELFYNVIDDTLIHELCHKINPIIYKGRNHDVNWKLCMIKMGMKPDRLYTGELPDWALSKDRLLREVLIDKEVLPEENTTDTEEMEF